MLTLLLVLIFALPQATSTVSGYADEASVVEAPKSVPNCSKEYGNPPAKRVVAATSALALLNLCADIPGVIDTLHFTDSDGVARRACLLITKSSKPLPLLVWLHPSIFPTTTFALTGLIPSANRANLSGTADGPFGYHILLPIGRSTTHIYPPPADKGLGWDNWYRNYNRSDRALNVDVQTIDYFIDRVLHDQSQRFSVDRSRIFMSGWSNGAAMAVQYALNTPGIAAAAVYSPPDPYRDYHDPCAQEPQPTHSTPILLLYNQCDVINICTSGTNFVKDLNNRFKSLTAEIVIVDSFLRRTTACNPRCTDKFGLGLFQHIRWPVTLNDEVLFSFFRKHQLL